MKRVVALASCALALLATREAYALKPIDVYSIWYSVDMTNKLQVETFESCLMSTSTFAGGWAFQWGIGPFTHHPPIVLTTSPPNPLQITTTAIAEVNAGMVNGKIPAPTANNNTVYIIHGPASVRNEDEVGARMCYDSKACAEHWVANAPLDAGTGYQYQIAIVPLDCPACGKSLNESTYGTFHELAEAAADEGSATFEVADACESHPAQLMCCGTLYDVQWLDNSGGPGQCAPISATGPQCGCGVTGVACAENNACCEGLVCELNTCCFENGQRCYGPNDCCGSLTCSSNGECTCVAEGSACQRNNDCCGSNVCDPNTKRCAPAPPEADAGADASDGGGGVGGCSCRTATGGNGRAPSTLLAGLVVLGVARRMRRATASHARGTRKVH